MLRKKSIVQEQEQQHQYFSGDQLFFLNLGCKLGYVRNINKLIRNLTQLFFA
jgi:hypothetical protein